MRYITYSQFIFLGCYSCKTCKIGTQGQNVSLTNANKIKENMQELCICHGDIKWDTVYPKKYAHGFVVLCFVVVMQSFIMNSHEVFIHIHQGCFAGTGAIVKLPQIQWSKPDGYGKISPCITTTKHSKAKTMCIFLGIYCTGIGEEFMRIEDVDYVANSIKLILPQCP